MMTRVSIWLSGLLCAGAIMAVFRGETLPCLWLLLGSAIWLYLARQVHPVAREGTESGGGGLRSQIAALAAENERLTNENNRLEDQLAALDELGAKHAELADRVFGDGLAEIPELLKNLGLFRMGFVPEGHADVKQLRSRVRGLEEAIAELKRDYVAEYGLTNWLGNYAHIEAALAPAPATPATCRCEEMRKLLQAGVDAAEQYKHDLDALANWLACHVDDWEAELEKQALAQPRAWTPGSGPVEFRIADLPRWQPRIRPQSGKEEETMKCSKCGSRRIGKVYHRGAHECPTFSRRDGEHLHYTCHGCGYDWSGPTRDTRPQAEGGGE
jgi:predicted nucleic-acid-binding Zn-ribbon protein